MILKNIWEQAGHWEMSRGVIEPKLLSAGTQIEVG